jgi:hypothetical protein
MACQGSLHKLPLPVPPSPFLSLAPLQTWRRRTMTARGTRRACPGAEIPARWAAPGALSSAPHLRFGRPRSPGPRGRLGRTHRSRRPSDGRIRASPSPRRSEAPRPRASYRTTPFPQASRRSCAYSSDADKQQQRAQALFLAPFDSFFEFHLFALQFSSPSSFRNERDSF